MVARSIGRSADLIYSVHEWWRNAGRVQRARVESHGDQHVTLLVAMRVRVLRALGHDADALDQLHPAGRRKLRRQPLAHDGQ